MATPRGGEGRREHEDTRLSVSDGSWRRGTDGGGEFAWGARKNRRREHVAAAMDDGLGYYDELLSRKSGRTRATQVFELWAFGPEILNPP